MLTMLISILEYAILAFLTYKLLENDKKIIVFLVNIICPMLLALIQNNLTGINIVSIIINGTLISFVCYFTYERYQDELNKYLGTTVLIDLILVTIVNLIIVGIYNSMIN